MRVINGRTDKLLKERSRRNYCIMRPGPLGNPFVIGKDGDRDEVCDKHMIYAQGRIRIDPQFRALVKKLINYDTIECCCSPKRCHGDNLVMLARTLNA